MTHPATREPDRSRAEERLSSRTAEAPIGDPTAWVLIPVHDRWPLTQRCLTSLYRQTYRQMVIVVVDDGSTDGTSASIAHEFSGVTVLSGNGDLWWTGATALGVEYVIERGSPNDYVLTLNNDTTVAADYVETLVRVCRDASDRALVGSVSVDSRDGDTITDGGPQVRWVSAAWSSENVGRSLADCREHRITATYPDVLPGRGTLIPVGCIKTIGNFNAKLLPHYAADYEFSARAARAGYRLVMSYEAPVHSVLEATGVSTTRGRLSWRQFTSMFVSRRSPACLLYRWRFGLRSAPKHLLPAYLLADTVRVIFGGLRDQLRGDAD